MDRTNRERTKDFVRGLHSEGYLERFLAQEALESAAREVGNPLGNTTHLSVMDADGATRQRHLLERVVLRRDRARAPACT